jgi:hypothetical protein
MVASYKTRDDLNSLYNKLLAHDTENVLDNLKDQSPYFMENTVIICLIVLAKDPDVFFQILPQLITLVNVESVIAIIHILPYFGSFKDYITILNMNLDSKLNSHIIELYTQTLKRDHEYMLQNLEISNAIDYAPSEKSSFHIFAKIFARKLFKTSDSLRQYRRMKRDLSSYNFRHNEFRYESIHLDTHEEVNRNEFEKVRFALRNCKDSIFYIENCDLSEYEII